MKISLAVYYENMDEFKKALGELKNESNFSASLFIAQEFAKSGAEQYVEYLNTLLSERPDLLTAYREEYGQPIVRQRRMIKNGREDKF